MASNQAAFLDGKAEKLRIGETELASPDADEVVIQNAAIAINPVDWKIQDSGMFVQKFPFVLGEDVAGVVHAVGSNVKNVKKGDRVIGHSFGLMHQQNKYGGFQLYTTVPSGAAAKIPASLKFTEAVVLPLAFDTALVGLCSSAPEGKGLGLPLPSLTPQPSQKTVVVWGGSSSVGSLVIQLAKAGGAKAIIAVASPHNHGYVKQAGATAAYDYNSPSVIQDVVAAMQSAGGEFAGVYDAISNAESYKYTVPLMEQMGGKGVLATVLPPPENAPKQVTIAHVFGVNPMTFSSWESYIPQALEQGKLKAIPEPMVVGKGLESIQKGCDTNKKGVSAKKVVVELD